MNAIATPKKLSLSICVQAFEAVCKPMQNSFQDSSFNGWMFETYGRELIHVREAHTANPGCVWSIVSDTDGQIIFINAFLDSNVIGFLITHKSLSNLEVTVYDGCKIEMNGDSHAVKDAISRSTQFYTELCESVEIISDIATVHGARTLSDLYALSMAILQGGFIDAWPDSAVLSVIKALPSGDAWCVYVRDMSQERDESSSTEIKDCVHSTSSHSEVGSKKFKEII